MLSSLRLRLFAALVVGVLVASACSGSSSIAAEADDSDVGTTESAADDAETTEDAVDDDADDPPATTEPPETTAAPTTTEAPQPEPEPAKGDFTAITDTVDAFVAERGLEGAGLVIVEREDGVVYEQYFGEFDADRISMIASSSKMISAGVLLRLAEDGLLDMNAPVATQVDWAVGNPDITPAQLVSNSSGLVGLGPNFLYAPYLCQWGVPDTLQSCGEAVFTTADDDADQVPPDSEFRYGGAQWQVAGAIAEELSGKTWAELIDEIYVQPCAVDSLGFVSLGAVLDGTPGYPVAFGGDPASVTVSANPNIEGGAHITAGDYAKLLLMHLRDGQCEDGTQVLSPASLEIMHTDRVSEAYGGDAGPNTGYGMGWWVDRETGRISDGGAWGALPWLDLDDRYGAYIIVEDVSATGRALADEIEDLVHTAVTGQ